MWDMSGDENSSRICGIQIAMIESLIDIIEFMDKEEIVDTGFSGREEDAYLAGREVAFEQVLEYLKK